MLFNSINLFLLTRGHLTTSFPLSLSFFLWVKNLFLPFVSYQVSSLLCLRYGFFAQADWPMFFQPSETRSMGTGWLLFPLGSLHPGLVACGQQAPSYLPLNTASAPLAPDGPQWQSSISLRAYLRATAQSSKYISTLFSASEKLSWLMSVL